MIKGGCLCGAIRYDTPGPMLWSGHCHCESCRKGAGAGVVSFFGVPRAGLTITGKPKIFASSPGVERGFCNTCGTTVLYRYDGWPDETHLYAATLDDPSQYQPQCHYHHAERVPWLHLNDDLPRHSGSAEDAHPQKE